MNLKRMLVILEIILDMEEVLKDNDAYHALKAIDGLIMTGPTGTNVNDLIVGLCRETI